MTPNGCALGPARGAEDCSHTPEEFSWFYTLKANKGDLGFYYFTKQTDKELQAVTKIKESLGNWKDVFFFTPEVGVQGHFDSSSKYL